MESKIKIGDWCVITSLYSHAVRRAMNGTVGHIFQVDFIEDHGSCNFYHATEETNIPGDCWPDDCIRKATGEEVADRSICFDDIF